MSDQPKKPTDNKSLSEISHLFLSSVRDRQTSGAPRPIRRPPGAGKMRDDMTIDLTPEEFAHVFSVGTGNGAGTGAGEAASAAGSSPTSSFEHLPSPLSQRPHA